MPEEIDSQTEDTQAGNEEGAGKPGAKTAAAAGSKGDLQPIVVNGKTLMLSQEEIIARAQKVEAAEEKFRNASQAIKFIEDMELAEQGDEAAFRRVGAYRKWAPEKVEQILTQRREAAVRAQVEKITGKPAQQTEEAEEQEVTADAITEQVLRKLMPYLQKGEQPITVDRLDPRLQKAMAKTLDTAIHGDIGAVIDKDPILGKLRKYGSADQREELNSLIEAEGVRRANAGADLTNSRTISEILQTVRTTVARLNIRPAKEPIPIPGLGPTATGTGDLHQGTEPPKRPKGGTFDPNYGEWMGRMLAHEMMKSGDED